MQECCDVFYYSLEKAILILFLFHQNHVLSILLNSGFFEIIGYEGKTPCTWFSTLMLKDIESWSEAHSLGIKYHSSCQTVFNATKKVNSFPSLFCESRPVIDKNRRQFEAVTAFTCSGWLYICLRIILVLLQSWTMKFSFVHARTVSLFYFQSKSLLGHRVKSNQ